MGKLTAIFQRNASERALPRRARRDRNIAERTLRRRLHRDLADLDIHGPTSMEEVCRRLGAKRGKPIYVIRYPLDIPGPLGLWTSTPSAHYIVCPSQTTAAHQEHIIAHELGHMWAGHESDEDDDAVWAQLMPDIPPDMIRRALRRTHYDSPKEREAELAATILLEAASVAETVAHPATSERARRAQQALGDPQTWL